MTTGAIVGWLITTAFLFTWLGYWWADQVWLDRNKKRVERAQSEIEGDRSGQPSNVQIIPVVGVDSAD